MNLSHINRFAFCFKCLSKWIMIGQFTKSHSSGEAWAYLTFELNIHDVKQNKANTSYFAKERLVC